jgi:hypothetical protein
VGPGADGPKAHSPPFFPGLHAVGRQLSIGTIRFPSSSEPCSVHVVPLGQPPAQCRHPRPQRAQFSIAVGSAQDPPQQTPITPPSRSHWSPSLCEPHVVSAATVPASAAQELGPTHGSPAGQLAPHRPQLFGSEAVSTQAPPQQSPSPVAAPSQQGLPLIARAQLID